MLRQVGGTQQQTVGADPSGDEFIMHVGSLTGGRAQPVWTQGPPLQCSCPGAGSVARSYRPPSRSTVTPVLAATDSRSGRSCASAAPSADSSELLTERVLAMLLASADASSCAAAAAPCVVAVIAWRSVGPLQLICTAFLPAAEQSPLEATVVSRTLMLAPSLLPSPASSLSLALLKAAT